MKSLWLAAALLSPCFIVNAAPAEMQTLAQTLNISCKEPAKDDSSSISKDNCIVAYFSPTGAITNQLVTDGYYRVLQGQSNNGMALVQDFFSNGLKQTDPYTIPVKQAALFGWDPLIMGAQGPQTTWYATGTKESSVSYHKGQKTGLEQAWYPNGTQAMQFTYEDGIRVGQGTIWRTDGSKFRTIDAVGKNSDQNINATMTQYFANGNKQSVLHFKNGALNGAAQFWDESGKALPDVVYKDGKAIGQ